MASTHAYTLSALTGNSATKRVLAVALAVLLLFTASVNVAEASCVYEAGKCALMGLATASGCALSLPSIIGAIGCGAGIALSLSCFYDVGASLADCSTQ